jgi:uncharacterized NAD-dependent epimerase/dehydratase family protein
LPHAAIPSLADECRIVELYGAKVIAVALNGERLDAAALASERDRIAAELGIPVAAPLLDGMDALAEAAIAYIDEERGRGAGA